MTEARARDRIDLAEGWPLGRLMAAFVAGDPALAARFPCPFPQRGCWSSLVRARLGMPLDPALARSLLDDHARYGASELSREHVRALAEGRAVAVVAGQQPAPFGGPLYTWHKLGTACALARLVTRDTGVPAVPVFWNATEDDDFEEVRGVTWAGPHLDLVREALPREAWTPGRLVGTIPARWTSPLRAAARTAWEGLAGAARVGELLDAAERAIGPQGDLGDSVSSLVAHAFAEDGIVVVDPRRPAFRAAALDLYQRYLERHAEVRTRVDEAGAALEHLGYARGFVPAQAEFALFAVDGDRRTKLHPADLERARRVAREGRPELAPSALLRPLAQDHVLPAVALVAGPGEVAYLAQLAEVYALLEVTASIVFPRWSATWLPAEAMALCAEAGIAPAALVHDPDGALLAFFAAGVPAELRDDLESLREDTFRRLEALAERARGFEKSLPELVGAVRARVDFQLRRLARGFAHKARRSWRREHPAGAHLRYFLRPGGRLQERSLSWLDILARGGAAAESTARELAASHVEDALAGRAIAHDLVPLDGAGETRRG